MMQERADYEAYVFDLYGTLVDVHTDSHSPVFWESLARFFSYHGARWDALALQTAFHADRSVRMALQAEKKASHYPDVPVELSFAALFDTRGMHASAALLAETARVYRLLETEYLFLYPSSLAVLERIKACGHKIFLLSNAQAGFTKPELRALGLLSYFDDIVISSEAGLAKPDPRLLLDLLKRHNLGLEKAIMIGNDLHADVGLAQAAGVDAAYVHTNHSQAEWLESVHREGRVRCILSDGNLLSLPGL